MSEGGGSKAAAGVGCGGCLALAMVPPTAAVVGVATIFGGLGVLFAPIIAIILLFSGGGGGDDAAEDIDTDKVAESVQGDGKGELDEDTVPEDLAETIQDAGDVCDAIGPVVIAAVIEHESSFNKDMRGNNGEEGISQLPPDKFDEFGEDTDDNDKTRATDAEDSIMAQGEYMCSLAKKVKPISDSSAAPEEGKGVLDMTLAAYDVGLEAVLKAKGVPETTEAQSYVYSVRSLFPRFEGIGGEDLSPSEFPTPSDYPSS